MTHTFAKKKFLVHYLVEIKTFTSELQHAVFEFKMKYGTIVFHSMSKCDQTVFKNI